MKRFKPKIFPLLCNNAEDQSHLFKLITAKEIPMLDECVQFFSASRCHARKCRVGGCFSKKKYVLYVPCQFQGQLLSKEKE